MKKIIAFTLVFIMILCACSCGQSNETTAAPITGDSDYADAISMLTAIWSAYEESEKFPASGGDESNLNFEGPGKYSVESAEMLDSMLGLPTELASKIDSAASLSHAMNANTFTCGAFHFKEAGDAEAAIAKIKNNILSRHWICGFPDSLLIMKAPGNYVIAVWGINENTNIVSKFKIKVLNTVNGATVAVEEPIV